MILVNVLWTVDYLDYLDYFQRTFSTEVNCVELFSKTLPKKSTGVPSRYFDSTTFSCRPQATRLRYTITHCKNTRTPQVLPFSHHSYPLSITKRIEADTAVVCLLTLSSVRYRNVRNSSRNEKTLQHQHGCAMLRGGFLQPCVVSIQFMDRTLHAGAARAYFLSYFRLAFPLFALSLRWCLFERLH